MTQDCLLIFPQRFLTKRVTNIKWTWDKLCLELFSLVFSGVRITRSLVVCVMFCRSLFVVFSFFFWPLCCLFFFDLLILINSLVSLSSSQNTPIYSIFVFHVFQIVQKCPHKFEKRLNKIKVVMCFSKYIIFSDPFTCFSLAPSVTKN